MGAREGTAPQDDPFTRYVSDAARARERLANTLAVLRARNIEVRGDPTAYQALFGERKTPEAFRNACHRFIYVENLVAPGPGKESEAAASHSEKKESPKKAVSIIAKAMEDADDDGWAHLGNVGHHILGAAPDFDPRTYGCPNLSTLVTQSGGFEVRKGSGSAIHIRRKAAARKKAG